MKGFTNPKEQKLHWEPTCQKDTKEGDREL